MTVEKVWVWAELQEGKVTSGSLELLTKARELGNTVEAVLLGADAESAVAELGNHGASTVYLGNDAACLAPLSPPAGSRRDQLMDAILRDDIHDLLGRVDRLRSPLQERLDADPNDPDLAVVLKEVIQTLTSYENELNKILSPRFDRPELARINETAKMQIGRRLDVIEDHLVPQIMRTCIA